MVQRIKLTATQVLNNPKWRAIFILSTLLVAVLVGAAPNDVI